MASTLGIVMIQQSERRYPVTNIMPSAENPNAATIHTAFQLQHLIENRHKNVAFIDPTTLKLIRSITDSHPADRSAAKTPEWAVSKESVQKQHNTLDRISEDDDEDIDAVPKKCLDAKLGEGIILHEISGRKVARYGKIVVKSGRHLKLSEAEAMKYITTHTSIPVPHVYEAVSDGKLTSITMDFIEGDRLDKVWNSLPETTKLSLAAQINSMLVQLRSLRGRYIGAVNNDKAIDSRRYDLEGGPFETEAQFNEFLLSDVYPQVPKCFLHMAERALLTNHAIVFAHGDLAPRNILVREGKVVAVLDWENAGWYPEYWDFVKTFNALDQRCNWYDYVDKIFPVRYEQEFMNDRFVGTLIRHGHS
ncbi:kinase-like domain protein [Rutstroemia sp. NJR-2017a BBW]|nr:kinase-like domain protein [Rutstroemia sp. NJR-2017a BBW]